MIAESAVENADWASELFHQLSMAVLSSADLFSANMEQHLKT
jgi:hypothetical protein